MTTRPPEVARIIAIGRDGRCYSREDIESKFGLPGTVIFYSNDSNAKKALEKSSLSPYIQRK